jgi:hypothetical protein
MNILVIFLLTVALLTAVAGSIGLMGTMDMNTLERTREIGVMRAIGAVEVTYSLVGKSLYYCFLRHLFHLAADESPNSSFTAPGAAAGANRRLS